MSHTDAHDRLDDLSIYQKPHFPRDPKCFSGILTTTWCDPQRSVSPWSAWRREAARHLVCGCRQRSAGCRGCARTATWRRATSGHRVPEIRVKNIKISNSFGSKMTTVVKNYHKTAHVSMSHTDAHGRLDDLSIYHKPHFPRDPKCFSGILTTTWCDPQRSVSPWSAWRREASAARRWRRHLVRGCRQRSAGCRRCARTATWRRATSGDRVVRRLVCVMFSLHV